MRTTFAAICCYLACLNYCFGQGASFQGPKIESGAPQPVPGLTITVCGSSATGIPCSPSVIVYSNQALTTPIVSLKTDSDGQIPTFFVAPGSYQWCASDPIQGRITSYCTLFTVAPSGNGSASFSKIDGFFYVDGVTYATVQQAITAACAVGGGTVWIPAGNYTISVNLVACSNLNVLGAGKGQADGTGCATTLTITTTSGVTIDLTGFNDTHWADFCMKYTGAGALAPFKLSASQRNVRERLYIAGPYLHQDWFFSSSTATASTIWNWTLNVHTTGTVAGGDGLLIDASDATAKVINNNYWINVAHTGGVGGFGIRTAGTGPNPVINENEIHSGEITTSNSSGTGVSIGAGTVRDLVFQNSNIEGNGTKGVVIAAGNTGKVDSSNISANATNSAANNVADSSAGGFNWVSNNIGSVTTKAASDRDGNFSARSFCIGAAACDPGNVNYPNGTAQETSGGVIYNYLATGLNPVKPLNFTEAAAPTCGAGADFIWGDSTAHKWKACNNGGSAVTVAYTDAAQTFTASQTQGTNGTAVSIHQHKRVTTGSIGATTRTEVVMTWASTFTDTNYTVTCNVEDSTTAAGTQGLAFERLRTKSSTQIGAVINNPTAGGITGTLDCVADHD